MAEAEAQLSVVVVDDEPAVLRAWREILRDARYQVQLFSDAHEALAEIGRGGADVAVVDIRMPAMDGMELLSTIKAQHPELEVVMMTGFGGVQEAVAAIKRGAYDFLTKPFDSMEAAELTVRRAGERRLLEKRVQRLEREKVAAAGAGIVGQSPAIKAVIELVHSVASSQATVLIYGESGTGKELVARALHEHSLRRSHPMVTLNCSALTETLLESELFGHTKGAFTGATANREGLFEAAHGSTLFLDEIGDMALATQAKLLRALQQGEVRPVGSTRTVRVDARVIAATNTDLEQRCRAGAFRQDLYYRLNVVRIEMPPLRRREGDIALLAHHFLRKFEAASGKRFDGIDAEALAQLERYAWPGNVRELENAIERAVILGRGRTLRLADLPEPLAREERASEPVDDLVALPFPQAKLRAVERFERRYLEHLLERHPSVTAAARAAGIDRSNFRRLLRRHGLAARRAD
jgi:two-component system response regulator HydG